MREIKFRAWSERGRGMSPVAVDLLGIASQGAQAAEENIDYRILLKDLIWMQYTGLKDKNGKEIYEGDVVKIKDRGSFRVDYLEHSMKFYFQTLGENGEQFVALPEAIEIIGNIYESPDLIG